MAEDAMKDKVVLITGSSRGIGSAIAHAFAAQGARVVVHGRDEPALKSVVHELAQYGGQVMEVTGDVTKFEDIERMRDRIDARFGEVDVLIANAGGSFTPPAPLEDIPEDGWRASVEGNLTATFLTLKCFLPSMKRRGEGVIITMASAAGRIPHASAPVPYGVAKAGVVLLTQDVAAQAGPFGVRVNCIAPETIMTERNRQFIDEEREQAMISSHPIRRLGTPQDVAAAAVWLASADAAWITGITLDVSGGAIMR